MHLVHLLLWLDGLNRKPLMTVTVKGPLTPLNLTLTINEQNFEIVYERIRHRIGTLAALHCMGIRTRVTLESHMSVLASFFLIW